MIQAIIIMMVLFLITVFGLGNMHQTRVNLPLAGGYEVNTIFLLILCFFLGYAAAVLTWCVQRIKDKKTKSGNNHEKRKHIR